MQFFSQYLGIFFHTEVGRDLEVIDGIGCPPSMMKGTAPLSVNTPERH